MADGLHLRDRSFGRTVLGLCAVASRHSDDPRTLSEGTTSDHSRGWRYFRQFNPFQACSEEPSLYSIQLCCVSMTEVSVSGCARLILHTQLCSLYLQESPKPDRVWLIVGIGIRSCQEMGVHRRASDRHQGTHEYELWKRAFWLLVMTDTLLCAVIGRPSATSPEEYV